MHVLSLYQESSSETVVWWDQKWYTNPEHYLWALWIRLWNAAQIVRTLYFMDLCAESLADKELS